MEHLAKKLVIPIESATSDMSLDEIAQQQPLPTGNSRIIDWSGMGLRKLDFSHLKEAGVNPVSLDVSNNSIDAFPIEFDDIALSLETLLFSKNRLCRFPTIHSNFLTVVVNSSRR
jgi:hypothetical protein